MTTEPGPALDVTVRGVPRTDGRPLAPTPARGLVRAGLDAPVGLRGDEAARWLAARQYGVASGGQLAACGLTAEAIRHRVERGRLHRVHRGVFAIGRADLPAEGRILAGVLAAGPGAIASHHSAGFLLDALPAGTPPGTGLEPVHVTATRGRRARDRPGIRCHVTQDLDARDLRWVGPVPTTSAARTALDVAAMDGHRTAERVLAEALRSRTTTPEEVRSVVTRSRGHHGIGVLTALVDAGPAFDRSVAERLLLELLRDAGLPEPRTNVRVSGFEVDALWADLSVVVEFDSFTYHGDVLAFRRDRRKSARLQAAGYDVVPVVWADLHAAPTVVVADIASVLAVARVRLR